MPDEPKTKSIDEVMQEAWDTTMGEAAESLPDENQHLFVETDDKPTEKPAAEPATVVDTPVTEPVSENPASDEAPVPLGDTSSPPQHWSETDKSMFATLPQEGKDFLLRRHRDMEGDYTRKTQENAAAVKIGQAVAAEIDPAVRNQLQVNNISDDQFIKNLISFHRFSMADPVGFVKTVMTNLRLDPAQVLGTKPQESQAPPDPINTRLAAIESHLTKESQTRQQRAINEAKTELQKFAEMKDDAGALRHPHLETVKMTMGRLMSVDPSLDLESAYDVAVYRDPELRKTIPVATPAAAAPVAVDMDKVRRGEEAARAAKANKKGSGNGATSGPATPARMTLQEALAAAADEVGLK